MRLLPLALLAAAAIAVPAIASSQTFHGPARAALTMGSKKVIYHGGNCRRTKDYFTLNIGTIVLGTTSKRRPPYFGITVGKTALGGSPAGHDGTYSKNVTISFTTGGRSYSLTHAKLTLAGHRTKGTFTGTLLGRRTKASGSFHC